MDDGLQNNSIYQDLKICIFDGSMGLGNGRILPSGPLRESLISGLKKTNIAIIIGEDKNKIQQTILKNASNGIGKHRYNIFNQNCQHWSTQMATNQCFTYAFQPKINNSLIGYSKVVQEKRIAELQKKLKLKPKPESESESESNLATVSNNNKDKDN